MIRCTAAMRGAAAAAPRHAPRSLAARPAARRRFTVSAGSGRAAEDLAKQVAAKEAELQNMFVSGRIPKAAVVAAMRKELADLRAELSGELGSATPHSVRGVPSAAASRPTGYPGASGGSILDSAPSSSSSATSSRMLNALKLVEAQLSVGTQGASLGGLSFEQQQELLQLQEENTRLKVRLDAVLARQAQLQLQCDQLAPPTRAAAAPASSGSSTASSAPSGTNGSVSAAASAAAPTAVAAEPAAVAA